MVLASALMRGIPTLDGRHFLYYQGVNASHKLTLARMTNHGYAKIIEKTKKSVFCIVSLLWHNSHCYTARTNIHKTQRILLNLFTNKFSFMKFNNYCQNRILNAIATQQAATYGLFLSPRVKNKLH